MASPEPADHTAVLPADTVAVTATDATVMMTGAGNGKMLPMLILGTREMGYYAISFTGPIFRSLVEQVLYFNGLSGEQLRATAAHLNESSEGQQP